MEHVKCVVVGDGAVGKTALIITFVNGSFPADYLPTVADKFQRNVSVDGGLYSLSIWDTAGQEGYTRLRSLSYAETDVFLVCYSSVSMPSFQNVREKWMDELKHYQPDVPCILVATKIDLRDGDPQYKDKELIGTEMGTAMAHNLKMSKYMEVSAKSNTGIEPLFYDVVRVCNAHKIELQNKQKEAKKGSGCILS